MNWEECEKQKVKKIEPNPERAKSMRDLAQKRLESIKRRRKTDDPEFITEDYYESIKELVTALLFSKGYKSYSHECLITFLKKFHPEYDEAELKLMDQLRQTRNDLLYRGEPVASEFLNRREKDIKEIIDKLKKGTEKAITDGARK
ncbi:MAG: HEPN domain-containing protein [Candidatus Altiarchaeota archaeon]|nr:HEPN domain-containing protein [Candidatus Altiarchaeota archaeon]